MIALTHSTSYRPGAPCHMTGGHQGRCQDFPVGGDGGGQSPTPFSLQVLYDGRMGPVDQARKNFRRRGGRSNRPCCSHAGMHTVFTMSDVGDQE